MSVQPVLKTPLQLQLEKINLTRLQQHHNIAPLYYLLKILNQIINSQPNLSSSNVFHSLYKYIHRNEQGEIIRTLPLFQDLNYLLWNNQNLSLDIREKTNFYKIVSNWIVSFELRSGNLNTIYSQFELIFDFMSKQTKTPLERLIMINEVYQDLKDLICQYFWEKAQPIKIQFSAQKLPLIKNNSNKQNQQNCTQQQIKAIQLILEVLELLTIPIYYRISKKCTIYRNCTYSRIQFQNVKQFIRQSIYFVLKQGTIPTHLQTQLTKLALIHLESLPIEHSQQILKMLKYLMIYTSKAVRFALVVEYVEFYDYLQEKGYEQVIEQLEEIIYFRELIIGKKIVQENISERSNSLKSINSCYNEVYIKAGTNKRIYFSNQKKDGVLKAEVLVEQNDINMKMFYFDSFKMQQKQSLSVFQTISKINEFSTMRGQKLYWSEQKATSKQLELKLQHIGLYCLQLDNCYSWLIPKNIKYKIQIYCPS